MISLSRHIELLLLEHNCVIVPGLGGFIANTASAVYNDGPEGDKLFMPPYRTIGFNPQLQVNDGLLVQSYMQAYDASYPAAYLQMEKEIEQLNMQLNLFGEYNLEGIGTLHKSLGQNIVLTSSEAGILTPSLYGTYSFSIKNLAEVSRERELMHAAEQTNIMPIQTEADLRLKEKDEEKKDIQEKPVIPLKRKNKKGGNSGHDYWAELGIAASVAAIIFLIWLIPNTITMNGKKETVYAGTPIVEKKAENKVKADEVKTQKPEPKPEVKVSPVSEAKAEENNKVDDSKANNKVDDSKPTDKKEVEPEVAKNYTIVLASHISEKYSKSFIDKLAAQGITDVKFTKKGKMSHIIYSAFETKKDARKAIHELREKNEAFKDAWAMKMN